MSPVRDVPGGVQVLVHVQPGARTDELAGLHGGAIKLRVSAPPVEGAANAAVEVLLAQLCGVPRRAVSVVAGASSRRKQVRIEGIDAVVVRSRLGVEGGLA